MSEQKLVKHPLPQRMMHWFNASSFLVLWLSGIAIVTSAGYRVAPQGYVNFVNGIFGSKLNLLNFHIIIGVIWITVMTLSFLVDPHGLSLRFLRDLIPTRNDFKWMQVRVKAELDPSTELPPQGAYNAGQKAFGITVLFGSIVIGFTGVMMVLGSGGTSFSRAMVFAHLVAVGVVIAFFFVHFAMAALLKEERPALKSMIKGDVEEAYVEHHHKEWHDAHAEGGEPIVKDERFALPRFLVQLLAPPTSTRYCNPYIGGIIAGAILVSIVLLLGSAWDDLSVVQAFWGGRAWDADPAGTLQHPFWASASLAPASSMWQLWALAGVMVGSFGSALISQRLGIGCERGEGFPSIARFVLAVIGGLLVGFAISIARGGLPTQLTHAALFHVGAWAFAAAALLTGTATAFTLKRIWR